MLPLTLKKPLITPRDISLADAILGNLISLPLTSEKRWIVMTLANSNPFLKICLLKTAVYSA